MSDVCQIYKYVIYILYIIIYDYIHTYDMYVYIYNMYLYRYAFRDWFLVHFFKYISVSVLIL